MCTSKYIADPMEIPTIYGILSHHHIAGFCRPRSSAMFKLSPRWIVGALMLAVLVAPLPAAASAPASAPAAPIVSHPPLGPIPAGRT